MTSATAIIHDTQSFSIAYTRLGRYVRACACKVGWAGQGQLCIAFSGGREWGRRRAYAWLVPRNLGVRVEGWAHAPTPAYASERYAGVQFSDSMH